MVSVISCAGATDPSRLADLALLLAEGAARQVRTARQRSFTVDTKSTATDLVTEVDRRTEEWLRQQINTRRPEDAILGEEGAGRDGTSGVRWLLDPIDGTVNFVLGLPHYAVSVAVEVDSVVVAGAVSNPVTGETFRARLGGGAFLGRRRLSGPRDVPLARAVLGTGFAYDAQLRTRQIAALAPLLPRVADIRRLGSAALDLCFVAAGRLDGYFEAGLHPWDHGAGGLVAAEAGCKIAGRGDRRPDIRFLVASSPQLAGELHAALRSVGADRVLD